MTLIIYQNLSNFFLINDMNCVKLITFYVVKLFANSFLKSDFDKIIIL